MGQDIRDEHDHCFVKLWLKIKYESNADILRNVQVSVSLKKSKICDGYQNRGLLAIVRHGSCILVSEPYERYY